MKKKKKARKNRKDEKKKGQSIRAKLKPHKAIVKFCLIFLGLLIILATTFPYLTDKFNPQVYWLNAATAGVTGFFLKLFGMATRVSGTIVSLSNFSVEVVGECTGLYEMLIFLAAMIAYPANYKKKLLGAVLGIPFLYAINIVRMVFIMVMGNWSPKTFDFMHMYFWQVAMILIIVSAWVLWIEKVVHHERKAVAVHS
jgi:archaeosortase B (VPXXXP-CTERM-specific)